MPLPPPQSPRTLIHRRSVRFEGHRRSDGLWDIEGSVSDVKTVPTQLQSGPRAAGEPVHEMHVRLTVDYDLNVRAAEVASDAHPYPGHCDAGVQPLYAGLVGLNLMRGFRAKVQELFGGASGCTHITELLAQFPTAAVQSMYEDLRKLQPPDAKPFQLDRCHALDTRAEAVRLYYGRWYRQEKTGTGKP